MIEWFNTRACWSEVSSQQSRKNLKEIAAEAFVIYIGAEIAYKHCDRSRGQLEKRSKTMAAKKARKSTKALKKSKKLKETRPLSWSWGVHT